MQKVLTKITNYFLILFSFKIDPKFVKCSKEQFRNEKSIDWLNKYSVLKLIPRGHGNVNVHNEVAALREN